jgi:YggT family protein
VIFTWIMQLIDVVIQVATGIVFINALLSWVEPNPYNPVVRFLNRFSDALCDPVRRLFPTALGGFDFAPLIVIIALQLLSRGLHALFLMLG